MTQPEKNDFATQKGSNLELFPLKSQSWNKMGLLPGCVYAHARVLFKHFPDVPIPSVNKAGGGQTDCKRAGTEAARGKRVSKNSCEAYQDSPILCSSIQKLSHLHWLFNEAPASQVAMEP